MKKISILSILMLAFFTGFASNCVPKAANGGGTTPAEPTPPADTTPPIINSAADVPQNNTTLVAINTSISVTFSESMNAASIDSISFTLADADAGNISVPGSVTYDDPSKTATFTPTTPMAAGHAHVVTVSTSVKDLAGNSMATSYGINFITDSISDTTAPTILSRSPSASQAGVLYNIVNINATFSEAVQPGLLSINLSGNTTGVLSGTPSYDSLHKKVIFTPSASLKFNEIYTVTINATDYANNGMTQDVYTFTIEPDTYPPIASSVNPANLSTGVGANSTVSITFNEPMNPADFTTGTFTLNQGTYPVSGSVSYSGSTATFTATYGLEVNKSYTASVASTVRDMASNAMGSNKAWSFTTGNSGDTTAPIILSTSPVDLSTSVATNSVINITFSESINTGTLNGNFIVQYGVGKTCVISVAGALTFDAVNRIARFTPTVNFKSNYNYTVTLYAEL